MKEALNLTINILLATPISFLFNVLLMRLNYTYWSVLDWHPARWFMDVFYPHVSICGETSYDVQLFDDLIVSNGIFMTATVLILILLAVKKARTPQAEKL